MRRMAIVIQDELAPVIVNVNRTHHSADGKHFGYGFVVHLQNHFGKLLISLLASSEPLRREN